MGALIAIDRELTALETRGRNMASYRRIYPQWMHGVLAYPHGWTTTQGDFSIHALDSLDHLAELLDLTTAAHVAPEVVATIPAMLDNISALLAEDDSITPQLRAYLLRLVQETRTAVEEHDVLNTFDLDVAMERLWVALQAAADQSEKKSDKWRSFFSQVAVSAFGGAIASAPTVIQAALTAGGAG